MDSVSPSFEASGLENGREYSFRISAFNAVGEGPLGDRVKGVPVTVPGAVSDLWTTTSYMGDVVLRWSSPATDGGSSITGYRVYRGLSSDESELISEVAGGNDYFEDTGLSDGTTYLYRVSAVSEVGEGAKGPVLEVTPLGVPTMVVDLEVEATSDTVELSWLPPENDHGSDVLGYYVYRGTSPVDLKMWKHLDSTDLSISDDDVESGTYYYRVVPYNSVGTGDSSDVDVDVPSRTGTAVMIGVGAFLIPLLIVFLAILLPALIKRNKKKREEREAREALERKEPPPPQPQIPPGPGAVSRPVLGPASQPLPGYGQLPPVHPQSVQAPTRQLPPMQSAPAPQPATEAYIRPERRAPSPRDKDSYLRQNGMRPSDLIRPDDHLVIRTDPSMGSPIEPPDHPSVEYPPGVQEPPMEGDEPSVISPDERISEESDPEQTAEPL
jgi:hypothetical protein